MTHKTALLVTTVLTAFVLVATGAVVMQLSQSATSAPAAAAAASDPPGADAPTMPLLDDALTRREAGYRQAIDDANAKLQDGQSRLGALTTENDRLRSQIAALMERDWVFRQRLDEAAALLAQQPGGDAAAPAASAADTAQEFAATADAALSRGALPVSTLAPADRGDSSLTKRSSAPDGSQRPDPAPTSPLPPVQAALLPAYPPPPGPAAPRPTERLKKSKDSSESKRDHDDDDDDHDDDDDDDDDHDDDHDGKRDRGHDSKPRPSGKSRSSR
ncbi:MAG: hypothetical protein IT307_12220 [Chloroflexi bacterium]|nr:hypothetical protein [Chloroflexota bacterium]